MKIVCLQKYRSGYRGFIEEPDDWVMFQFSRRNGLHRLATYPRSDFRDYSHFIGMMSRFVPADRFLPAPVPLAQPDLDGFDRLWRAFSRSALD